MSVSCSLDSKVWSWVKVESGSAVIILARGGVWVLVSLWFGLLLIGGSVGAF